MCVGRNNAFSATTYLWTIWAIMTHNWKSSIRKGGIKWQANSSKCKECAEHVIEDLLLTIFLLKKTNYWTLCIILCLLKRANICLGRIFVVYSGYPDPELENILWKTNCWEIVSEFFKGKNIDQARHKVKTNLLVLCCVFQVS